MASKPRWQIFNPRERIIVHVWNKFARDLRMLGIDGRTGEVHLHRVRWVQNTEAVFGRLFAIEVRTTAIMGNHVHLVLENRPDIVPKWSDREVVKRWLTITKLKICGGTLEAVPTEKRMQQELAKGRKHIKRLRKRLANISWYMGAVSECISRQINREEDRKGTCWQGRFQCRVAKTDDDVRIMMMYVDLNPLRANICDRVEESDRSGAGMRLQALLARRNGRPFPKRDVRSAEWLAALYLDEKRPIDDPMYMSSQSGMRVSDRGIFWFSDEEYYCLLDLAARQVREGKSGVTPPEVLPIIERLGMSALELTHRIDRYSETIG